jgi:hypothetical protein
MNKNQLRAPGRSLGSRILAVGCASALLFAGAARAQPVSPAPAPALTAVEHYRKGIALTKEGAWAPALAEFLEVRRLEPQKWSALAGAATCLHALGRYDEALDLIETLLRGFPALPAEAKTAAQGELIALRGLVGTIEVDGAEPGAAVLVDRESRGEYPLTAPLRVAAGQHILRVHKEGFEPFEARLDVAGGATARAAVRLRQLRETGTIEIFEARGRALEVIVDGDRAGTTGPKALSLRLAPGKHVVFLRGEGNLGTAPASVEIRVDEIAPLRVEAQVLDAALRVVPVPFDALISVDSVLLGRGRWEGRVRSGTHTVEVAATGFLPEKRAVSLARGGEEAVRMALSRDPRSPFWRKPPPPPHFVIELGAAPLLVPAFGGAGTCGDACSQRVGVGAYGVVRGGYQLGSGLGFGLSLGALAAMQKAYGKEMKLNLVGSAEALRLTTDDVLALRGLFVGGWVGYTLDVGLPLSFRLGAGGLFGAASDARLGKLPGSAVYEIGKAEETHPARFVFVTPEVRVGLPLGPHVTINAGVEIPILIAAPRPQWSECRVAECPHPIRAGSLGYGWFNPDAFLSRVVVGVAPTVGARFDL